MWYTSMSLQDAQKVLNRFHDKYPFIVPEMYRSGGERLLINVMAEARANTHRWDVITNTGAEFLAIQKKGLFAQYFSPHRQFFRDKDPDGYWTDAYVTLYTLGYNSKLVPLKDVPRSYEDLLHPKWKGKMAMDTKAFYWFAAVLKIMGEEKGLEFMRRLATQDLKFRTGVTLITTLMGAGEVYLGITLYNHRIEEIKRKGAPVEWMAIEPVIPEIHPFGIAAKAPHPNAARLFVDFILSREGQGVIATFPGIPSHIDVDAGVPKLKKGLKIMPFDTAIAADLGRYVKLYREILMKHP